MVSFANDVVFGWLKKNFSCRVQCKLNYSFTFFLGNAKRFRLDVVAFKIMAANGALIRRKLVFGVFRT